MEVTCKNFQEVLPELKKAIDKCVFMAIDTEFTGLTSGLEKSISAFDTPEEYYCKLKKGSLNFLMVQFGLVTFMYNSEEKKYTYQAYNFYVFPTPFSRQAPDCRFMCQASSIEFLASHGFDFNKLFTEGIPYLNKKDEEITRTRMDEARDRRKSVGEKNNSIVECPPEHEKTVKDALKSIADFLSASKSHSQFITLPPANGFVRKLIYQEVWKNYSPDDLRVETSNGSIVVRRPISAAEKAKEEQNKCEREEAELDDAIGFSNVIRLISQSRKLVVGHNMLLDLCHIIHRFCEPLPESYQEFKEILHCIFPYVLDTKFMCASEPLSDEIQSSILANVLATVTLFPSRFHVPKMTPESGNGYSLADKKEHEAGYDAFITGHIAIALYNYIVKHNKIKPVPVPRLPSANSAHLSEVLNRLFLMKVVDSYIYLDGSDPEPNRDAVFHVTFPEEWKTSDLINMFSPFGGIQVSWINNKTAFCCLHDKTQVMSVMQKLVPATPTGVTVITYYAFTNLTQPSPVRRRSGEVDKTADSVVPGVKRKHSLSQESSLKRPSVDPIPEEPEEQERAEQTEEQTRKKQKLEHQTKSPSEDARPKLFEENVEW